jgi:hypothetical protein
MTSIFKTAAIGAALAASAVMVSSPAEARDRYRRGNDGAAIAAGVIGLAAIAAIASSSNRNRYYYNDYYYPRSYYPRYRVYRTYPRYYGYRYDTYPRPYRRHRYYRGW